MSQQRRSSSHFNESSSWAPAPPPSHFSSEPYYSNSGFPGYPPGSAQQISPFGTGLPGNSSYQELDSSVQLHSLSHSDTDFTPAIRNRRRRSPTPGTGLHDQNYHTQNASHVVRNVGQSVVAGNVYEPERLVFNGNIEDQYVPGSSRLPASMAVSNTTGGQHWHPVHATSRTPSPRRRSLQTWIEDEAGFPGCNVLVQQTEERESDSSLDGSDARESPGPRPIRIKKRPRRAICDAERAATKLNRIRGVCLRCKAQKEKCREFSHSPCRRCSELKPWRSLCVPAQFTDRSVFSRSLYKERVFQLAANIHSWIPGHTSGAKEVIHISNGYQPQLPLTVYKFEPRDRRLLEHILWRDAASMGFPRFPSSPYGLKDNLPKGLLDTYLDQHVPILLEKVEQQQPSSITSDTLWAAYMYTKQTTNKETALLVEKALRIWVAQKFYFGGSSWSLSGPEKVEMEPINLRSSGVEAGVEGITPLPRLLNQQLDSILESRIASLEGEILNDLQNRIHNKNKADWFGVYLTIYCFFKAVESDTWALHTWERDNKKLSDIVKSLGPHTPEFEKAWTWPLPEKPNTLIQKNLFLIDTLVAHFRAMTKGNVPFTLDWDNEQGMKRAGCEESAVLYMRRTIEHLKRLAPDVLKNRKDATYERHNLDSFDSSYTARLMMADEVS